MPLLPVQKPGPKIVDLNFKQDVNDQKSKLREKLVTLLDFKILNLGKICSQLKFEIFSILEQQQDRLGVEIEIIEDLLAQKKQALIDKKLEIEKEAENLKYFDNRRCIDLFGEVIKNNIETLTTHAES